MHRSFIPTLALVAIACASHDGPQATVADPAAAPHTLDALFGGLPEQCARSEAGERLLKSSMTLDESSLRPLASAAVDAPAELGGVFGAPRVEEVHDEYTSIEIPVQEATLFGLPVAVLITYWGHENGIGGMQVHFAAPRPALVDAVGPRLVDGEWDHPEVLEGLSPEGHAIFVCDWSM